MSLTSPTHADFSAWLATATDHSKPLLERQLALSLLDVAMTQLKEGLRVLEKMEVPSLQNAAGLRLVQNEEARAAFVGGIARGEDKS